MIARTLCALLLCNLANAGEVLDLRMTGKWESDKASAKAVLMSVASEFVTLFPETKLPPIEVEQKGGPITLYQRGPKGEIRVKLNSTGSLWAQHAFQFAHELGHVMCRYDTDTHPNKWFEESICELASLFVLRRMAKTWETKPPYPNWKNYAKALNGYADERLSKARLPEGVTLAQWYGERREFFNKNATERDSNLVIAAALLAYFEEDTTRWQAVEHINTEKLAPIHGFPQYLAAWKRNCGEKHKPVVDEIAKRLGVKLED